MKVSVLIPTFNSRSTIVHTIESVLQQSIDPVEILIMDDGSVDNTLAVLDSYRPRVAIFQQENRGVAAARNELCRMASGDLIAFLDHDDLWHPEYLKRQCKLSGQYPNAAGLFTGHIDFRGYENFRWNQEPVGGNRPVELIHALDFLRRYNRCPGAFASMSYCCIPRAVLERMGPEPFATSVSGADDFCLCNRFPLFGPVAYDSQPLVAYRITEGAQSADRLKGVGLSVDSFELLSRQYSQQGDWRLARAFSAAHASKKRSYAKILMGAGRRAEAREQILRALSMDATFLCLIKSAGLLGLMQLPGAFQPSWPSCERS